MEFGFIYIPCWEKEGTKKRGSEGEGETERDKGRFKLIRWFTKLLAAVVKKLSPHCIDRTSHFWPTVTVPRAARNAKCVLILWCKEIEIWVRILNYCEYYACLESEPKSSDIKRNSGKILRHEQTLHLLPASKQDMWGSSTLSWFQAFVF